jgi:phage baseplate assembly protein W
MTASNQPAVAIFSDVNPDVTVDGPYELVFNETDIEKSLDTCFMTKKYSRPFRRLFGSRISDLLFEPMTQETADSIGAELTQVAKSWETRITEVSVIVLPDYDNQQYYVNISYRIPQLGNKMANYTFNLSKN